TLRGYEVRYGMKLPAEYRSFLLTVGSGGAGPYYGLLRLAEALRVWDHGDPSKPFPHTKAWNLPAAVALSKLSGSPSDAAWRRTVRAWTAKRQAAYNADALLDGAIPLSHIG